MNNIRPLIEDCCGWNRRTWGDAIAFALAALPKDLRGKTVLEIGAGRYSSLSPIFAALGADTYCSYYGQARESIENGALRHVSEKHKINGIGLLELDIHRPTGTYDVIVLKSVLGGICRGNDYAKVGGVIRGLMDHLSEDGVIVTLDNGHLGPLARMSELFGAGKNRWTYFKQDQLQECLAGYDVESRGFGFLNFGAARFMLGRDVEGLEVVNNAIHTVDAALLRLFGFRRRAVLATVIRKRQARSEWAPVRRAG